MCWIKKDGTIANGLRYLYVLFFIDLKWNVCRKIKVKHFDILHNHQNHIDVITTVRQHHTLTLTLVVFVSHSFVSYSIWKTKTKTKQFGHKETTSGKRLPQMCAFLCFSLFLLYQRINRIVVVRIKWNKNMSQTANISGFTDMFFFFSIKPILKWMKLNVSEKLTHTDRENQRNQNRSKHA